VVPAGELRLTRREDEETALLASGLVVEGKACVLDVP
jgi:DNA-binding CsgD family transcriptional regulator